MIEWEESIKFPGILLDEDLNWKDFILVIQSKVPIYQLFTFPVLAHTYIN